MSIKETILFAFSLIKNTHLSVLSVVRLSDVCTQCVLDFEFC